MLKSFTSILLIGTALAATLAGVHHVTGPTITDNRNAARWQAARELTGDNTVSGPWLNDQIQLADGRLLERKRVTGYGGEIEALLLIEAGRSTGVRVIRHKETPGIADFIDRPDRGWMLELQQSDAHELDTVSGATITSNALVRLMGRSNS